MSDQAESPWAAPAGGGSPSIPPPPATPARSKLPYVVAGLVGAVLALVVAVVVLATNDDTPSETTAASDAAAETTESGGTVFEAAEGAVAGEYVWDPTEIPGMSSTMREIFDSLGGLCLTLNSPDNRVTREELAAVVKDRIDDASNPWSVVFLGGCKKV